LAANERAGAAHGAQMECPIVRFSVVTTARICEAFIFDNPVEFTGFFVVPLVRKKNLRVLHRLQ
jgi:hypothetical protein